MFSVPNLLSAGAASAALAVGLLWAIRRTDRHWALWMLALAPAALTYFLNASMRVNSYHGFLHLSLVYQIFEGHVPPTSPLLAGQPIQYTWAPHLVVAVLSRAMDLSPAWVFAALNLMALALTVLSLFLTARYLCGEYRAAVLGVAIAMFGFSFIQVLPLGATLRSIDSSHGLPLAEKFTNMNVMPLGVLCFSIFLYALSRIVSDRSATWGPYLLLFVSVAGAGFLYPLHLLAIGVGGACAMGVLLLRYRRTLRDRVLRGVGVAVLGAAPALPYLVAAGSGVVTLAPPSHYLAFGPTYLFLLLPVAALILYARHHVRDAYHRHEPVYWALGAVCVASALLSVAITGPVSPGIEYKYRVLSYLPLGLVAGVAVERLRQRSALIAFLILALLLLPMTNDLRKKITRPEGPDGLREEGVVLHHADPLQDALYGWIATETSPQAAFVDTQLTIPVFARRALFVGLDWRREHRSEGWNKWDGWRMSAETTLQRVLGGPRQEVELRIRAAEAVLSGEPLDEATRVFDEAIGRGRIDQIYVVLRDGRRSARLERSLRFAAVFRNERAVVYRFRGAGPE